nr:protein kibra-like isoform X4 [Hydra vulgaris]
MYFLLIYLLLVVYGFPICCNINFLILVSNSCATPISTSCATPVSTSCATPVISTCATPVTSSAVTSIPSAPPSNGWLVKYDHLNEKMYTRATEYM